MIRKVVALVFVPFASVFAANQSCAPCHSKIVEHYQHTGMGRSLSRPAAIPSGNFYHAASDTHFEMIERGGKFFQRRFQIGFGGAETNIDEKQIDYVLGSGSRVRTFLHRTAAGALQQLPLAWYAEGGWAMNPGYDTSDQPNARRKITYECMFCHNAYPEIPSARFRSDAIFTTVPEGIDCARCHGSGDRHVAAAKSGARLETIRAAIVNPARLAPDRAMEVCLQCHLETTSFPFPHSIVKYDRQPFSYRPGEPLGDFQLYFDHPEAGRFQIVSSAYRLRMSRCFLKSGTALQCTTCHDPHRDASAESIDRACLKCHASLKTEHRAKNDCASCHMPKRRAQDVVHAVMTDHLIRRTPLGSEALAAIPEPHEPVYRGEVLPYDPARIDSLYLALAQVREGNNLERGIPQLEAALQRTKSARAEFYVELGDAWVANREPRKAVPYYQEAIRRDPDLPAAFRGLGIALDKSGDAASAAGAFEHAAQLDSSDAAAWQQLGAMYTKLHRAAEAMGALRRAVQLDPEMPEAHYALGLILSGQAGDPQRAESAFREAIRLRPDDAAAHMNLAIVLYRRDRREESAYHFERALRYQPDYALGHLNYGRMLEAAGDRAGARAHFLKAAESPDPEIRDAARKLASK